MKKFLSILILPAFLLTGCNSSNEKSKNGVGSVITSYEERLMEYSLGELMKGIIEEYGYELEGNEALEKEASKKYEKFFENFSVMKSEFAEKTGVFPEQVRGIFYYKDELNTLFAKVVNAPTHWTDSGHDDEREFWKAHYSFPGTEGYTKDYEKLTTGGLYKSENNGDDWKRIWEGDRIISAGVCPNNQKKMYVLNTETYGAGSGGAHVALYVSENAGENWELKKLNDAERGSSFTMYGVGYHNVLFIDEDNCDHLVISGREEFGEIYEIDLKEETLELLDIPEELRLF